MPPLSPSAFAVRFRALSAAERRAFLAALWSARGGDARIEGGRVVADAGPGSRDRHRIAVVGPLERGRVDADVVVATRDTRFARRVADRSGATYLTPSDLRERLLYGVDRETGERIARDHLGTDLTVPPPPERGSVGAPVVAVAVVVALVAVVALSGVGLPAGDTPDQEFETPVPAAEDGETATPDPADAFPPGISEEGVTSAERAMEAHRRSVQEAPRAYTLDYSGQHDDGLFGDTNNTHSRVEFHSDGRYLVQTTNVVATPNDSRVTVQEYWADGEREHVYFEDENGSATGQFPLSETTTAHRVERLGTSLYADLLRAGVDGVILADVDDGENVYELYRDEPFEPEAAVETFDTVPDNFGARAYVREDGALLHVRVTYEDRESGEPVRLGFAYTTFEDVDPPDPPEWFFEEGETESNDVPGTVPKD